MIHPCAKDKVALTLAPESRLSSVWESLLSQVEEVLLRLRATSYILCR